MKRIITFGPGPKFKGGIANYNTSLAKAYDKITGIEVHIVSWTQQYPAIVPRDFVDRKSKTSLIDGTSIQVHYITNYNNPVSWYRTYRLIKSLDPDLIIFQWAIAIQGIPLGWITRRLVRKTRVEVIFDLHFVQQKEGSKLDMLFTRYGIKYAHTYVVHSFKTANELRELFPHRFIRKYKGLHHAIRAFAKLSEKREDISLLIVGESFWQTLDSKKFITKLKNLLFGFFKSLFLSKKDDERNYRPLDLIDQLHIRNRVCLINEFVPNEEVHKFFQVSDYILLFYETATPSGVESMACNFRVPILATGVGHFPETIRNGYNGYLAEPENIDSMAAIMQKALDKPINTENVFIASKEMSWEKYAKSILG